jgi:hypothetical protein
MQTCTSMSSSTCASVSDVSSAPAGVTQVRLYVGGCVFLIRVHYSTAILVVNVLIHQNRSEVNYYNYIMI